MESRLTKNRIIAFLKNNRIFIGVTAILLFTLIFFIWFWNFKQSQQDIFTGGEASSVNEIVINNWDQTVRKQNYTIGSVIDLEVENIINNTIKKDLLDKRTSFEKVFLTIEPEFIFSEEEGKEDNAITFFIKTDDDKDRYKIYINYDSMTVSISDIKTNQKLTY